MNPPVTNPAVTNSLSRTGTSALTLAAIITLAACSGSGIGAVSCGGGSGGAASSSSAATGTGKAEDFVARPDATRHEITGKVVQVDAARAKVMLAHEAIPNYMGAMTMEFAVKEGWAFRAMQAGDTLRGTLVVDGARSWIEGVSVSKTPNAQTVPQGAWTPPTAGTPLPGVRLTDQDASPLTWDRFRGTPLVLTFIYTRCPLPDYCPLMMQRFAALEQATAADPALARTRLLSISVDPAFDTPAVLRAFGERFATGASTGSAAEPAAKATAKATADSSLAAKTSARFARWSLATGDPAEVKRLTRFFGLDYFDQDGQIMHALRTAIVDPQGRVYKVFEGNEWTVEGILQELRSLPADQTMR